MAMRLRQEATVCRQLRCSLAILEARSPTMLIGSRERVAVSVSQLIRTSLGMILSRSQTDQHCLGLRRSGALLSRRVHDL